MIDLEKVDAFLRKKQPTWYSRGADVKKLALLEMAKNGLKRPHRGDRGYYAFNGSRLKYSVLSKAFSHYKSPKDRTFDDAFVENVRTANPAWLEERSDITRAAKIDLLAKAKAGAARPRAKTLEYQRFFQWTNSGSMFDKIFYRAIKKARPEWLLDVFETKRNAIFEKLRRLAKAKAPRPKKNTDLSNTLSRYSGVNSRFPAFRKEIRLLAPQWFERIYQARKNKILARVRAGKPVSREMWSKVRACAHPSSQCYDKEFHLEMVRIAPVLFELPATLEMRWIKKKLVSLAKRRKKLPLKYKNRLRGYTCSGKHYDAAFSKSIRAMAPRWFMSQKSIKVARNKQTLLKMASAGIIKPKQKTFWGRALCAYINGEGKDREFIKKLKIANSQWLLPWWEIMRIHPRWMNDKPSQERVKKYKTILLNIAMSGRERPNWKSRLGRILSAATVGGNIDLLFKGKLISIRRDWFGLNRKWK